LTPRISVVIAAMPGGRLGECLESLRSQVNPDETEVIVAGSGDGAASVVESFTWARFVENIGTPTVPRLLGSGITAAAGEIIAITDSSCVVAEDWIGSIARAHSSQLRRQSDTIIGGAVEIDGQPSAVDWAAFFCEYAQFLLPLSTEPANEIPGNNLAFRREALEQASRYVHPEFWKSYWSSEIRKQGAQILASPEMVVRQEKHYEARAFLVRRFNHGRCFAGMRLASSSVLLRFLYGVGSLLLPFILMARVITTMLTKRRYLRQFCLSFHFVLLAVLAWSLGELCGYFGGAGKSCSRLW
jgi:glycosyltransferase involved in cell wall biosynthesis